jgi:glycosyltransferase involved in cell wall biosynthesis
MFGLPKDAHLIGSVGRLVPVKNHLGLVTAFHAIKRNIPDAHLAIVGNGGLKDIILTHAGDLGLSRSLSIIPTTPDIARFYGALDLFVLSSHSEGLPLTVLEAFASGLPVVTSAVGGIPEIITNGTNGYTVPRDNASALAEKATELLLNKTAASKMGATARATVEQRFTAERMVTGIENVYDAIFETER